MSHAACCALGACCPRAQQLETLAEDAAEHLGWNGDERKAKYAKDLIAFVLEHYDVVPRGVGAAIVEGYKPFFKERK